MTARNEFENPEIVSPSLSSEELQKIIELQRQILAAAVIGEDYEQLFAEICTLAESFTPNSVATIMLHDREAGVLRIESAPSLARNGFAAFEGLQPGDGSCGNAVFHNEPMYVCNTFEDPRWKNLVHVAKQFNICSCFSFPIRDESNRAVGSFAISSFEHRQPSGFHRSLLDTCTSIIGVLLQRRRDQEARKRLMAEQERTNKLTSLGVLAGGIAHDFNNLLASMLGYIDLAYSSLDEGSAKENLEWALKSIERQRLLTSRLLTFSRGGAPVRKPTNLLNVIYEAGELVFASQTNALEVKSATGDPLVLNIDPLQIGQIFQNLFFNASQAMLDGGKVTVSFQQIDTGEQDLPQEGSYLKISVSDQGPGIPPEIRDRVFDPYFTTKEAGSGMGLAMCYSIAKSHGGTIAVEPTESKGACLALYLPFEEGLQSQESGSNPDLTRRSGVRQVLVMDDDELVRGSIKGMLESFGFEPILASDGVEALAAIDSVGVSAFDAIILDLSVPCGLGGLETSRQIFERDQAAKIIVTSGYSEDKALTDFQEHGFAAALPKPFRLADLKRTLAAVVNGNQ